MQTQTSSALHNAIMEASGKDRSPMLAPGNYVQGKSRIKRYIDTKQNHELIHFCLKNSPYQYKFLTTDANANPVTPGNKGTSQPQQPRGRKRFVTIVKKSQDLNNVSYHKLYDILKQHQNEVNEIRVERLARTANPFALVAQQQQLLYHSQTHPTHYTQSSSTRSQAVTRNRGNVRNPKRAKDSAYHEESMLMCKQEEARIQLSAEQVDRRDDTDDEAKDLELKAHYMYMEKIQEVTPDAAVTLDLSLMLSHCKRTKKPIAVPISTSEPNRTVTQSVATPHKKSVASESTIQKPRSTFRKLYEHVSKTCSWWYSKIKPPGYKWEPKSKLRNVNTNLVEIILFIFDSGCSNHMTGISSFLLTSWRNFSEQFNLEMINLHPFLDMEIWFKEMSLSKGFTMSKG
uniref:Integrase, catalytic region, zinc finger, CCHC-type, peptidase aspartic, catalytic n=1 Tax=Tanacetum cinerariifolium TaxID=118510 RepID=A0A6L2JVT5_TANCI|nr:hypothetical protein [Tanacetum cinerariifolium]